MYPTPLFLQTWTELVGCSETSTPADKPSFDNAVYQSERTNATRSFCLAYLMEEEGVFLPGTNIKVRE